MIIGLTGQSGAGKSTVAAFFAGEGFRIIDCDALVHALYEEEKYIKKIAEAFGEEYIAENGTVDRKKLGALVFSDKRALTRLNETVHPLILDAVIGEMNRARFDGVDAILDAPLLFEYELEKMCDLTLGVVCDIETAEKRLSVRDGRSPEEIRGRLASQHDTSYFYEHCDYILENNGDTEALQTKLADLMSKFAYKLYE